MAENQQNVLRSTIFTCQSALSFTGIDQIG